MIKHLTNLADNNESDEEGNGSTVEKGTNFECVRLMTMHASKGLQFPIVIMSGGFKGDPNRSEMYITRKDGQKVLTFKTDDVVADEKVEELKRLFYVAYTRPEYLLILPYYEKVSSNFIKETLESYMLNYPNQYLTLEDSGVSEKELREKVKKILNPLPAEEKDKEAEEKDKEDEEKDNELRNNQMEYLKKLIRKLPSKSAYKHSYSSMSHPKENIETIDEEMEDKEGAETEGQFIFDTNAVQVEPLYNKGINPIVLPIDYPAGSKLGTALHEVFEGLDFTSYEEKLEKKIKQCFNKQGIKLKDEWLEASINIVRNVLNATLPVIEGSCVCDKSFSFKDIPFEDKLDEVEFKDAFRVLFKECLVGILCGLTLAVCNFFKLIWFDGTTKMVALVVCLSLFLTVLLAKIIGAILPILADKLHLDPAVMANPIITTIVDAGSLLVYFQVASFLLGL